MTDSSDAAEGAGDIARCIETIDKSYAFKADGGYPKAAFRIRDLEAKARAASVHAKWGTRPPKEAPQSSTLPMEMCWSCNVKTSPQAQRKEG